MSVPTVAPGPHRPVDGTPSRRPGSVRRTTSVDAGRPDGPEGDLVLHARGRDLVTPAQENGSTRPMVAADQTVRAVVEPASRVVRSLRSSPDAAVLETLTGRPLGGAFRQALARYGGWDEQGDDNLLYALLDELPSLSLVSGFELQRLVGPDGPTGHLDLTTMVDVCAGWAAGTSMVRSFQARSRGPWIVGPPAPDLTDPADRWAWHEMPTAGPGTVRRARRTDLCPPASPDDPTWTIDAMFRDTYTEDDGTGTVIHEYAVRAVADMRSGRIVDVVADPRVLPATECPAAAASAGALVGAPLAGLRSQVRRDLQGNHTCTHLNDLLRTFADLPALLQVAATATVPR